VLRHGDLALDPRTRQVRRGDRAIALTRLEFELLELLLRNQRFVLTRDVIFDRVWGYGVGTTSNTLNVHIGYRRVQYLQFARRPRANLPHVYGTIECPSGGEFVRYLTVIVQDPTAWISKI
jgi:DNA-binding response OmpR family regulator